MANTVVELQAPPGLTLTLELYAEGSDTLANVGGDTLTEATNRHGVYTATVTEALSGYYHAVVVDGSDDLIVGGWVKMADDANIHRVGERSVAIEGTLRQLDDLENVSAATVNAQCDLAISDAALATASALATVDTNVDAILVDTGTTIPATLSALNDLSAADVNAQCDLAISDAALATASALAIVDTNVDAILVDTNELQTDWTDGGRLDLLLDALITEIDTATAEPGPGTLAAGTAQGGTSTTIQLAASETFGDDILNGNIVKITSGTGAGQSRRITDYTGATDTATVHEAWITTPDNTSTYEVVEGSHVTGISQAEVTAACDTSISNAALATSASVAALNNLSAADVNAQVVDVVNVDTLVAGVTVAEALRRIGAVCAGEISGAGTGTETVTPWDDGAETVVFTVDSSGNRTAVAFN